CPPLCGKVFGASLAAPARSCCVWCGCVLFRPRAARSDGGSFPVLFKREVKQASVNECAAGSKASPHLWLCLASARSARRMNDAAPMEFASRGGSQGSARKGSTVRATLRGCSIQGVSRATTFAYLEPHSCFLWLLSLQQQRK